MLETEPPFGQPESPVPDPQVEPERLGARLSTFQSVAFAGMWVPTILAGVLVVFVQLLEFERWTLIFMLPTLWFFWQVGVIGWRKLYVRPYWAGFVSGLAGFLLLPTYAIFGIAILAAAAQSQAVHQLSEEVDERLALRSSDDEQLLIQSLGTGFGVNNATDPQQERYEECFNVLIVGFGDVNPMDQALKRARRKLTLYRADPEDVVMTTVTNVCGRHRDSPVLNLEPYFAKSVTNAIETAKVKEPSYCEILEGDFRVDPGQRAEAKRALNRILCEMDEADQDLLLMEMAGFSRREMAEELNISTDAAKKRFERAMKRASAIAEELDIKYDVTF